jgi:septum formation protein
MTRKIILASTSPRRIHLLKREGIDFESVPSDYEEDMTLDMPPHELAMFLSRGKAEAVAKKYDDAIVIGGDTFISFEGKVLGKPHTPERAREMLTMLSGRTHSIISGYTIIDTKTGRSFSEAVEGRLIFRDILKDEMEDYIKTEESLKCAGGYALQGEGKKFVERFEGDYDSILGLPVKDVIKVLKDFGA